MWSCDSHNKQPLLPNTALTNRLPLRASRQEGEDDGFGTKAETFSHLF
jgi:hypothetical protein